MEATDISFVQRTTDNYEKSGYEEWSFFVNNEKYVVYCDIRVPGLVSIFHENIPEDKNKVCMTDIIFIKDNIPMLYDPKQSTVEVQKIIQDTTIKILLEKIKPVRDFAYINFVYAKSNKLFFKEIFDQICIEGSAELKQKVLRIITPEAQALIDANQLEFLTGPLK